MTGHYYIIKLFGNRTKKQKVTLLNDNSFFKPTVLYKEFMILDLIEKNKDITQRMIADQIGVAVSMINAYVDQYQQKDYIKRKYISTKTVEYFVTKKGMERRKLLNIWYLKSSNEVYLSAKDNIINFLNQIINRGFKKILLYGAGEVAEIMLQVMNDDNHIPLEVLAIVDDDQSKQNEIIVNKPIIGSNQIYSFDHDGILVSSFKHHKAINYKLDLINYNKNNIINFFDN
jgi:FlaA1/EpsC-like NDP-sugar epimerase